MKGAHLSFERVVVDAGAARILDVPQLEIAAGLTTAVLGPNGAGKSTLLRVAAGLRAITSGDVMLDGRPAAPAERRAVSAAVLQRPLLGRGSARRNAELGLRFARVPHDQARRRADAWLDRLGVAHLADRRARQLSGGEAQRISLVRALVLEPRLLVLDEPFAPLDATTRGALLGELRAVLAQAPITTLLVTHDAGEAAALADRIAVLHQGAVRRQGTTRDVFARPGDAVTARLLGYDNVLDPGDAATLGVHARRPIAFRAADLQVVESAGGRARVMHSVPVAGAARVTVHLGHSTAVGICSELAGLPAGTRADAHLAVGRCVELEV